MTLEQLAKKARFKIDYSGDSWRCHKICFCHIVDGSEVIFHAHNSPEARAFLRGYIKGKEDAHTESEGE